MSPKRPVEPLSPDEVRSLLRGCSPAAPTGVRNRALITAMYRGGLRVNEALALRPVDVDPVAGTLRVLHGKGDLDRVVAVDDGALAAIQRWMDKRRELGIRGGTLFCTLAGGKVSDVYVRALVKRLARKAGIEKRVHPHGLRHTHAKELVDEGVSLPVIRDQLGHSSLAVTDRYLRHVAPADVIAMGRARPQWDEHD